MWVHKGRLHHYSTLVSSGRFSLLQQLLVHFPNPGGFNRFPTVDVQPQTQPGSHAILMKNRKDTYHYLSSVAFYTTVTLHLVLR